MRILPKLLLCSVITASGCGSSPPGPVAGPATRKQPAARNEPPAVALVDLSFEDATVAAKFRRFDAAAKAIAKPQWTIRPYRNVAQSGGPARFSARWCERTNDRGECDCAPQAERPSHCISLTGISSQSGDIGIDGLALGATYLPITGWGAQIEYSTYGGAGPLGRLFNLRFHHEDFSHKHSNEWSLTLINSSFTGRRNYGELQYEFQVSTHGTESWMGEGTTNRDEQLEQYLASAESFRDAALVELDVLEKHCRDQISSGKAVIEVVDYTGASSDNPPQSRGVGPDGDKSLSEAQKAEVLTSALAEIDRRREIVREHYEAQYAALKATFPLLECLQGE
jgi:hypothetical protein